MLTAEGCRRRRERLWQRLDPKPDSDHLRLADPIHLMYLANFHVDPFSLGGGFGGYLLLRNDGQAKLLHDNRLPESVSQAQVEERVVVPWYDGQSPARGPRSSPRSRKSTPPTPASASTTAPAIPTRRRSLRPSPTCGAAKIPDEIDLMKRCMRATEAGHAWRGPRSSRA